MPRWFITSEAAARSLAYRNQSQSELVRSPHIIPSMLPTGDMGHLLLCAVPKHAGSECTEDG